MCSVVVLVTVQCHALYLIQVSRGLTSDANHITDVYVEGAANNSFTFSSLQPLIEYNFAVSIRAGPFNSIIAEGRLSPIVSLITPATSKLVIKLMAKLVT